MWAELLRYPLIYELYILAHFSSALLAHFDTEEEISRNLLLLFR